MLSYGKKSQTTKDHIFLRTLSFQDDLYEIHILCSGIDLLMAINL